MRQSSSRRRQRDKDGPEVGECIAGRQLTRSIQLTMIDSELHRLRLYQGNDHTLAKNWRQVHDDVSDLHLAAFFGDLVSIKRILNESKPAVNVDIPTTDGPKLMKEPRTEKGDYCGSENYVGFFLNTTPLMMAAQQGCLSVVKYLVDKAHADVNASDSIGLTPLSLASAYNHKHVAKFLLTRRVQRNTLDSKNAMSPLIFASLNNHTGMCKLLVKHRVNFHIADRFGRQAIHYAAWNYNWKLVEMLYQHNSRALNAQDCNRNTPLHLLVSDEEVDPFIVEYFDSDLKEPHLVDVMRQLLKFGGSTADVKRESRRGTKRLGEEHECLVQMIKLGASLSIRNDKGQTPLHVLCARLTPVVYSQGYVFIEDPALTQTLLVMLKILLKSGSTVNRLDFQGSSPLTLSIERKNWLAAKILGTDTVMRSEVMVERFSSLADTVATYGWGNLFEHSLVEKDLEYMTSAALAKHKDSKKSNIATRILSS